MDRVALYIEVPKTFVGNLKDSLQPIEIDPLEGFKKLIKSPHIKIEEKNKTR